MRTLHLTSVVDDIIKKNLLPSKSYIYGFADLTGLLDSKFEGFNHGISIGQILDYEIVNEIVDGPTMKYHSHYKEANRDLADLTKRISDDLKIKGIVSLNIEPTVSTEDLDTKYFTTLRTDLSHKMVATRAGLGWIGKTDLFISKRHGPRLRLVSILLKSPLIQKLKPIERSRCGSCSKCVEICPAKAANGKLWNINVRREDFFDPWKCRQQCAEFGKSRLGANARVCGMCVAACPIGKC